MVVGFSPKRYTYDVYLLGKQKSRSRRQRNHTNSYSTVRVQGRGKAYYQRESLRQGLVASRLERLRHQSFLGAVVQSRCHEFLPRALPHRKRLPDGENGCAGVTNFSPDARRYPCSLDGCDGGFSHVKADIPYKWCDCAETSGVF